MLLLDEVDHPSFSNLLIFVVLANSHFKTTAGVSLTTLTNRSCSGATTAAATAAAYEKNTYVPRSSVPCRRRRLRAPHARSSIRCIQRPREKESRRGERERYVDGARPSFAAGLLLGQKNQWTVADRAACMQAAWNSLRRHVPH